MATPSLVWTEALQFLGVFPSGFSASHWAVLCCSCSALPGVAGVWAVALPQHMRPLSTAVVDEPRWPCERRRRRPTQGGWALGKGSFLP